MTTNIKYSKVEQDFYPLAGGLDLLTPALELSPGKCFDAQNYEPQITGGYRRIDGYERFDGRTSPSSAPYYLFGINKTGPINVGDTLSGATSGATCKVLQVSPVLVVGRLAGNFQVGETINDGVTVGTVQTPPVVNGAPVPTDDANYALLAANDLRTNIGAVPGSGPVRGVKLYNGNVYAFRDNVAANAGLMYKATANGWQQVNFGFELLLTTLSHSAVVTFSGTTVTWNAHQMVNSQPVQFTTTGTFPTGIVANFTYYVVGATTNGFSIASTPGGATISISGGSGTLSCTALGATITAGAVVTGLTSGASATVAAALLRTGTWTTNLVGNLVFASVVGVFNGSEILTVNGIMVANTLTSQTAISRLPGGTVEFCNINFTGSATGTKMYGADGVNPAFEFDGTNYVVLHTGSTPDTPSHVINFKEMLFLGIQGNIVFAQPGNPYNWDPINGAGNIGVGDVVTGFLPQGGTYATGSTMAIFSLGHLFTLHGSSVQDFRLVTSIWDMGFAPYTMQTVSNDSYGWTSRGIQTVISTLTFGDFDYNSVSHEIQPLINAKQGQAVASCSLHAKDQYRVFFADGTAIVVGLTGEKPNGILPLRYNFGISCVSSDMTASGQEVTYIGSTNGYVYQDNIGTSQDGSAIEAWLRLPFNHSKSPRTRKRYRRAIFEGVVNSVAAVNISYDIGYGNPMVRPSASVADTTIAGGGGYWDQFTWDQFTWDAQIVSTPTVSLQGAEKNISFLIYSNYAQYPSHTFQGVTIVYSPWRLER